MTRLKRERLNKMFREGFGASEISEVAVPDMSDPNLTYFSRILLEDLILIAREFNSTEFESVRVVLKTAPAEEIHEVLKRHGCRSCDYINQRNNIGSKFIRTFLAEII